MSVVMNSYVKKLGHPLKEIRERALKLLTAKLQLGWKFEDELQGTRQLLEALLLLFQTYDKSMQHEVLFLLLTIIKTETGTHIAKEKGINDIIDILIRASNKIEPDCVEMYNDILETLKFFNTVQSQENVTVPHLALPFVSSSDSSLNSDNCESSRDAVESNREPIDITAVNDEYRNIPILLFPWIDLSTSDAKSLVLIGNALKVVKSIRRCCRFVCDVFLKDFPAEVFLNRPKVYQVLLSLVNNGQITEPVNVLLYLTKELRVRIRHIQSMELICQTEVLECQKEILDSTNIDLEQLTNCSEKLNGYQKDELEVLKQIPAPIYALDTIHAVLLNLARNIVLFNSDNENNMRVLDSSDINISISLIDQLVKLLIECVSESFWCLDHKTKTHRDIAHKSCMVMRILGDVLTKYRSSFKEDCSRVIMRIGWLRLVDIARTLANWARDSALLPKSLIIPLQAAHLDQSIYVFYPRIWKDLCSLLEEGQIAIDKEYKTKYKELDKLFNSMASAACFMKNKNDCRDSKGVLDIIKNALPVLDLHFNQSFLQSIGDVLFEKIKVWDMTDDDWSMARSISLTLMSHSSDAIRVYFYKMLLKIVQRALVSEEGQTDNEKSMNLFCSVDILTEICCHGLSDDLNSVRETASDVMLFIIRGRMVLTDRYWWRLLASLLPILPLLQVYASSETLLGQAIIKCLNEDIAERMGIPKSEIILGLVRMLHVVEAIVKVEAAHSICHFLDNPNYLPPKENLRADILITALRTTEPTEFNMDSSNFTPNNNPAANLVQILEVLKQDLVLEDVEDGDMATSCNPPILEPGLRLATLQQLSVMMHQTELHDTFFRCDGINIVVAILRMSLYVKDCLAYPDCAISCVLILRSVCYPYRHILIKIASLPEFILRVMLIFPSNTGVVAACCQLLSIIAWSGFVLQQLDKERKLELALPSNVVKNTHQPFIMQSYWNVSPNMTHSAVEWLQSSEEWWSCIRIRWWCAWQDSLNLRDVDQTPSGPVGLRPTSLDFASLRALSLTHGFGRSLLDLQNATDHSHVHEAIARLHGLISLVPKSYLSVEDITSLPWNQSLSRYLTSSPASPRDLLLLNALLKFVIAYIEYVPHEGGTMNWIISSVFDSEESILKMLSQEQILPFQSSQDSVDIIQLQINIVRVVTRCIISIDCDTSRKIKLESLLKIMLTCLEKLDLRNFHKLGCVNELVRCIRYITNAEEFSASEETILNSLKVITCTLKSFSPINGRKGESCRLDLLISLIALIRIMHHESLPVARWSEYYSLDVISAIVSCAKGSRPESRAAALHLLASLVNHVQFLPHILHAIETSISEYALMIFVDRNEANVVRAAAASLLTTACARPSKHTDVYESDILQQMNMYGFANVCNQIFIAYCSNDDGAGNKIIEPNIPLTMLERRNEMEVLSLKCSLGSISSEAKPRRASPTWSLVEATAEALFNATALANCPLQQWSDQGVYRILFKCQSVCKGSVVEQYNVRKASARTLARVGAANRKIRMSLSNTKDCVQSLLNNLKPISEDECTPENLGYLGQSLHLMSVLLYEPTTCDMVWEHFKRNDITILYLILQCLEFDGTELQEYAIQCLTHITQMKYKKGHGNTESFKSRSEYFDSLRSPYYDDDDSSQKIMQDDECHPEFLVEDLCKILISVYEKLALDKMKYNKSNDEAWSRICCCLSAIFSISLRARAFSVHCTITKTLMFTLQSFRDKLSLHGKSVEIIRNADNNPTLQSLYYLLLVMSSVMVNNPAAKECFVDDSITNSLIRLWPWCMMTEQLRHAVVHLLLVYTNDCPKAWNSMCVCVSNTSVLTEVCTLATHEVSLLARKRPEALLSACFKIMQQCVSSHQCRANIMKSGVLCSISKVSCLARCSSVQSVAEWSGLVERLSRSNDGAAGVMALAQTHSILFAVRHPMLMVAIAHMAHHQRTVFLQTPLLVSLVCDTLLAGDTKSIISAARAAWALSANSHKAKLQLRSAGVTSAVQSALERMQRLKMDFDTDRAIQILTYTNTVLQTS